MRVQRVKQASHGLKIATHDHFVNQAILTQKVSQIDLAFDVQTGFISRSVHIRLQVSVCSDCNLCHLVNRQMSTHIQTSNVTAVAEFRSASARLFAGMWHPLVSVITTICYAAIIFHLRVWYRALSLHVFTKIQVQVSIIVIPGLPAPNFVSFTASIPELAHGEKLRTQSLTQSLTQLI